MNKRTSSPGAAGPNPNVVRRIWDRVAEFQFEQQSKTAEVWQPIVDHGEAHRVAIENMTQAIRRGDMKATKAYFDEAEYHELTQREKGVEARQYFLSKVQV
jgi:hypothetical protein